MRRASEVLGFESVEVANLFYEATPSVVELNLLRRFELGAWRKVRQEFDEQIGNAAGLLAAWGVTGASGPLREMRDQRASWVLRQARAYGHTTIWAVGGQPRHPSRWHQYVADRHGRTSGGTFEDRLRQVLVPTPLEAMVVGETNWLTAHGRSLPDGSAQPVEGRRSR